MRHALASALLLAGLTWPFPPAPTDGHDLRGGGVARGTVLLLEESGRLSDAILEQEVGGKRVPIEMGYTAAKTARLEVLAVEGRRPVKYRVAWSRFDRALTLAGAQIDKESPLAGRAAVFERKAGAWSAAVEKPRPGDPANLLALVRPWACDESLYPARRVKVGQSWEVPEADLKAYFLEAAKMKLSSGKGRGTFEAVESVDGEPCAVVAFTFTLSGTTESDGTTFTTDSKDRWVVRRSLRTGLTLRGKTESESRSTLGGDLKGKLTGKESAEMTLKVDKAP